jgi:hypothetical protein
MSHFVLVLVVSVQIALFQFVSIVVTRRLFSMLLSHPNADSTVEAATYLQRIRRQRLTLGTVLLAVTFSGLFPLPAGPGVSAVLLAVASVTSAVAFSVASIQDRRLVESTREVDPGGGIKYASLEPRSLRHWYNPVWEALPIATLLATSVFTIWFGDRLGRIPIAMLIVLALQALFVVVALWRTAFHPPGVSSMPRLRCDRPEVALRLAEQLAANEMQFFMIAKVGISLLLAVMSLRIGLKTLDDPAAPSMNFAHWAIVGLLLLTFAGYLVRFMALTKRTATGVAPDDQVST